jgi:predicted nucleotidyltransferase
MVSEANIAEFLRQRIEAARAGSLLAIWMFGSATRGETRADSDLDLAFLCEKALDPYAVFVLAQDLASSILREVDLIDLSRAPTTLRAQVAAFGRRIHTSDARRADEFEMYALSDYARLNEERREIVASMEAHYRG